MPDQTSNPNTVPDATGDVDLFADTGTAVAVEEEMTGAEAASILSGLAIESFGDPEVAESLGVEHSKAMETLANPVWKRFEGRVFQDQELEAVPEQELPAVTPEMILKSESFGGLDADNQALLTETVRGADSSPDALRDLKTLLDARKGEPPLSLLLSQDAEEETLLQNLHALLKARQFAHPRLNEDRLATFEAVVELLANPAEIKSKQKDLCAPGSPAWEFAARDPAELSRVAIDMLTVGEGTFRDGSAVPLEVEPLDGRYPFQDPNNGNIVNRALQSSFHEFANGADLDYRFEQDAHFKKGTDTKGQENGLFQDQQTSLLSAFYGTKFDYQLREGNTTAHDLVDDLIDRTPGIVQAYIAWTPDPELGLPEPERMPRHAIGVTGVENGRVYYRNPWGNQKEPNGTIYGGDGPTRRLEDRETGLESMTVKEFERVILSIASPEGELEPYGGDTRVFLLPQQRPVREELADTGVGAVPAAGADLFREPDTGAPRAVTQRGAADTERFMDRIATGPHEAHDGNLYLHLNVNEATRGGQPLPVSPISYYKLEPEQGREMIRMVEELYTKPLSEGRLKNPAVKLAKEGLVDMRLRSYVATHGTPLESFDDLPGPMQNTAREAENARRKAVEEMAGS